MHRPSAVSSRCAFTSCVETRFVTWNMEICTGPRTLQYYTIITLECTNPKCQHSKQYLNTDTHTIVLNQPAHGPYSRRSMFNPSHAPRKVVKIKWKTFQINFNPINAIVTTAIHSSTEKYISLFQNSSDVWRCIQGSRMDFLLPHRHSTSGRVNERVRGADPKEKE